MKKTVFVLITLCFTLFGHASYIEVKDTIKTNTTWSGIDTVKVTGNIVVNNLVTLTIEQGTVVEFQGVYQIEVKGTVKAVGTETDSIVFTAHDKENGWGHFLLSSVDVANDTSEFRYCIFEYSKPYNKPSGYKDGASFYLSHSNTIEISNSTFRYNKGTNSVIVLNAMKVSIYSNTFIHNDSYCFLSTYAGQGNRVFNNRFINNTGQAAIYSGVQDTTVYTNNLMVNNYRGYYLYGSYAQIVNSTVVGSTTSGITFSGNSDAKVQNSIFWGNQLELQINDVDSDPGFYNCDIEGGSAAIIGAGSGSEFSGDYIECIHAAPKFIDSLNYDFRLKSYSPLVNKGMADTSGLFLPETDLAGFVRIYGPRIDIGAFETDTSRVNVLIGPGADQTYEPAISVQLTFDKEISGFDVSDLIITNGTAEITDTITDKSAYILTIVADTFGTVTIELPENSVSDIFGNGNIASDTNYIYLEEVVIVAAENLPATEKCSIYPNPATEYTILDLGKLSGSNAWYQLFDIQCRPVLTETIPVSPAVVDLSNVVPGTYYLKVMENNTEVRSFIVVKTW